MVATKRKKKPEGEENLLPAVTTWRGQIDSQYWLPTESRAKSVLHFSAGDVQIDEVILGLQSSRTPQIETWPRGRSFYR
jgi:hypothetical protein